MRKLFILFLFLVVAIHCHSNTLLFDTAKVKAQPKKTIVINDAPLTNAAKNCEKIDAVITIIEEAIDVGAPTYNDRNYLGCYKIYEGAAYKVIHKYGAKCKQINNILEAALEKSYGNYSVTEKAWILRMAFDSILGVPTTTK